MDKRDLIELVEDLQTLPKETEWVEFKSGDATTNERLGIYISAISNAACLARRPFGYMVFGIHDETHDVMGTSYRFKNRKAGNQELELWIRYFPLPDYSRSSRDEVVLEIYGHSIDENYSKLLIEKKDLTLTEVILLDNVQKKTPITTEAAKLLKSKGLIEGRRPNYHISSTIAAITGQQADYLRSRGFKDQHYKNMILSYLEKYDSASKKDIDKLILDILPEVLDKSQKENKVRNLLYAMHKRDKTIVNQGNNRNPIWKLSSSKAGREEDN